MRFLKFAAVEFLLQVIQRHSAGPHTLPVSLSSRLGNLSSPNFFLEDEIELCEVQAVVSRCGVVLTEWRPVSSSVALG